MTPSCCSSVVSAMPATRSHSQFAQRFHAARDAARPEDDPDREGEFHHAHWVRFHSLPRSKRYADSDAEDRTIVRRTLAVLDALNVDAEELWVVCNSWSSRRVTPAQLDPITRRALVDAQWVGSHENLEPTDQLVEWVSVLAANDARLGDVILAAAEDRNPASFAPPDFAWLLRQYDGGCDVWVQSAAQRDALAETFASWLSPEYLQTKELGRL